MNLKMQGNRLSYQQKEEKQCKVTKNMKKKQKHALKCIRIQNLIKLENNTKQKFTSYIVHCLETSIYPSGLAKQNRFPFSCLVNRCRVPIALHASYQHANHIIQHKLSLDCHLAEACFHATPTAHTMHMCTKLIHVPTEHTLQ